LILGITWITLLVLLTTKELANIISSEFSLRLSKFLTVLIAPLLAVFALITILNAANVLGPDFLEPLLID